MGGMEAPIEILRAHTNLGISEFARATGIDRKSFTNLASGQGAGGKVLRALQTRWALEIRQLGLTTDDFLWGAVQRPHVTDQVVSRKARK